MKKTQLWEFFLEKTAIIDVQIIITRKRMIHM